MCELWFWILQIKMLKANPSSIKHLKLSGPAKKEVCKLTGCFSERAKENLLLIKLGDIFKI